MLMSGDPGEVSLAARANIFYQADWHIDSERKKIVKAFGNTTPPSYQKEIQKFWGTLQENQLA